MSNLSFLAKYHRPEEKWQNRPALNTTLSTEIVNAWLVSRMDVWGEESIGDESLWIEYQTDFDGWTREHFQLGSKDVLRGLRNHLRAWGVYIPKNSQPIAVNLEKVLKEEVPVEWSEEEFQRQVATGHLYSRGLERRQTKEDLWTYAWRKQQEFEICQRDSLRSMADHSNEKHTKPTGQLMADQSYKSPTN